MSDEGEDRKRTKKIKEFAQDKTPKKLKNPTDIQVRFRTGFVYVAVSVVCLLASKWTTLALLVVLAGISAGEFYYMLRSDAKLPNEMLGIIAAMLYPVSVFFWGLNGALCVNLALLLALIVWYVFWMRARVPDVGVSLFGAAYTGLLLSGVVVVRGALPDPWGGVLVLGIFLSVWANDSFAYLVGSKFGKHKLAPRTSPKKSWEGFIAGLAGSAVFWCLMAFIPGVVMSIPQAILFGLISGLMGVLGDLAESRIKRNSGFKDSGTIMPGHGGLLDRCDSLFLVAVTSAILLVGEGASRMSSKKRIVVLGSTGSIGTQTLEVVRCHADKLEIVGLAVGSRADKLLAQAREFGVRNLAVGDVRLSGETVANELREHVRRPNGTASSLVEAVAGRTKGEGSLGFGANAVVDLVRLAEADVVVNALVGAAGLRASYETLAAGKVLALANKESLVVGGDLIMSMAAQVDTQRCMSGMAPAVGPAGALMPIDSEHGAIYQCLLGENPHEVTRLWVTASGGPFRGRTREELADITPAQALAHPTWNMGAKISIDSSTLMNKGLEIIEAHHLFAMPYDRINVVVQPQSAIHSMVEFADGSVKAHLGTTDMRIPIQFALSYPDRWDAPVAPLDFTKLGSLEFAPADTDTFRCLALARMAGEQGGTLPCAMNAANEVAVAAFLAEEGTYLGIAECVEAVMDAHEVQDVESLEQLETVDAWARARAKKVDFESLLLVG